ncbi:HutD/Ves family protein [Thalassotalea litorea]|uniref:HutD/Ves family protein n=1 Tax=Thalassotalea litorea TaxID=2020715 RepID=UPI0037370CE6
MPYHIIEPAAFKSLPWKNGKGSTIELAINNGATLDNFDWRLSMADVVDDGQFSDFSGYLRNLILIRGNGLTLRHSQLNNQQNDQQPQQIDILNQHLSFATFDGANKTVAKLHDGAITDFNVITAHDVFKTRVSTYPTHIAVTDTIEHIGFVYGLSEALSVTLGDADSAPLSLASGHLLQVSATTDAPSAITITGENFILIQLTKH